MEELSSVKEILEKTGKYTSLTMGISMRPIIHQQRDNIIIVKNEGRLKKYDVPVYQLDNGKYVMHRIVDVKDDHYVIYGDNTNTKEIVTDDMICGKLIGYYKNGKKYIDCENNKLYKLYARVWTALLPIRPLTMFINRCIIWAENHIFRGKVK